MQGLSHFAVPMYNHGITRIGRKRVKNLFAHRINDQLELRLVDYYDAETMFQMIDRNREHLSKWFPWTANTLNAEHSRAFIEHELRRFASNNGFTAGIFYEGHYIGSISIHDINWDVRATSIGYWIGEDYQGRGIVTACCQALLNHGFGTLKLNRIEIRARTDNDKSRAIPVRLGFREEGILRNVDYHNDRYYDHAVYGLLRDEWEKLPWADRR